MRTPRKPFARSVATCLFSSLTRRPLPLLLSLSSPPLSERVTQASVRHGLHDAAVVGSAAVSNV